MKRSGIGVLPIGSVIPVADAGAWGVPGASEIRQGFALANGVAYPPGSHPTLTGNRPNISDGRFLMNGTVGVDSFGPSFTTGGNATASQWSVSTQAGFTIQAHYHYTATNGSALTVNGPYFAGYGTGTYVSGWGATNHRHRQHHTWPGSGGGIRRDMNSVNSNTCRYACGVDIFEASESHASHDLYSQNPSHAHLSSAITGWIGNGSGIDGSVAQSASLATSATIVNSHSDNRPFYFASIFVVRVA